MQHGSAQLSSLVCQIAKQDELKLKQAYMSEIEFNQKRSSGSITHITDRTSRRSRACGNAVRLPNQQSTKLGSTAQSIHNQKVQKPIYLRGNNPALHRSVAREEQTCVANAYTQISREQACALCLVSVHEEIARRPQTLQS